MIVVHIFFVITSYSIHYTKLYDYHRASLYYQFLFNGKVYTSSDNFYDLDSYWISSAGLQYDFGKKKNINVLFQVFNIENKEYQNVLSRPMPGRNYNLSINFKL